MPPRPPTVTEQIDNDLARSALAKRARGEKPTQEERAALKRVEAAREDALRWAYYSTVPKTHYAQLSGRQPKVLNQQATRYGLPIGGKLIDLGQVLARFHNLLATFGHRLVDDPDDAFGGAGDSPAIERMRAAKAGMAELQLQEAQRQMIPRREIHDVLARNSGILRQASEILHRQFGNEAGDVLTRALDDCEREVRRVLADDAGQVGT